ncbi:MAG: AcrR family transcriptional regulator [Mariniblastus sp.]|jgi:AcrR family transcriptional regulator
MDILTPKKREILERETQILEAARAIVVSQGYHGLNMDRIAAQVNYSKGTIYNHFSCKEEIIIALAIQNSSKRTELFQQAAQFKGCSRHRMMAIGEAAEKFVREYPDYFLFEQILQLASVLEKTSEKRQAVIQGCEMQCMSVVAGLVRDAIAAEALTLPDGFTPEKLVFGIWSLTSGAFSIVHTSDSLQQMGLDDPYETVRDHTAALLDGYGWTPLSREYDAHKVLHKIHDEVFHDE